MIQISKMLQSERNAFFREALGLPSKCKLPEHGIDARVLPGTHYTIRLRPIGEKGKGRRMQHRIFITCPCGQTFSAGRLGQHLKGAAHV